MSPPKERGPGADRTLEKSSRRQAGNHDQLSHQPLELYRTPHVAEASILADRWWMETHRHWWLRQQDRKRKLTDPSRCLHLESIDRKELDDGRFGLVCVTCGKLLSVEEVSSEPVTEEETGAKTPKTTDDATQVSLTEILMSVSSADDVDAIIVFLRQQHPPMDPMDRALLREKLIPVLKGKGISAPTKVLDTWFKMTDIDSPGQGTVLTFATPEPWDEPVDGAELLDGIVECFNRFVVAEATNLDTAALWSLYTHVYDLFDISPLLCITSPTKRCGKSLVLRIVRRLSARPLMSSNVTPAALFRAVEAHSPTLLVDEADTFVHLSDELRGILNAGHTRDTARVIRAVGEDNEPRTFSTWAPKAMTAIGSVPETIDDRGLKVRMARKQSTEIKMKATNRALDIATASLVRKCRRWAEEHELELRDAELPSLEGVDDRAEDNWAPLVVIADIAGGEWPARSRAAALALAGGDPEEATDYVRLFAGIREAFGEDERLGSIDLVTALGGQEDGPRAELWGRDLAEAAASPDKAGHIHKKLGARLKRDLAPFGIKPMQLWLDGKNVRGYQRAQFASVWETYAPDPQEELRNARNARTKVDGGASDQGPSVPSVPGVPGKAPALPLFSTDEVGP